mmetsp:Transcript_174301/g.558736  ORF Transcript_174301/g.558736 Transcript_174301/m.558736 type:complete len:93 (+) Transcript_174301:137-415(+)
MHRVASSTIALAACRRNRWDSTHPAHELRLQEVVTSTSQVPKHWIALLLFCERRDCDVCSSRAHLGGQELQVVFDGLRTAGGQPLQRSSAVT